MEVSHLLSRIYTPNVMRVSNEHFDDENKELDVNWHPTRPTRVDWAKAEAQAEAEFSAQRTRLIQRFCDRDYPNPEVIDQIARMAAGNFS